MNIENIKFIKVDNENLELACKIQNEIFPDEDARQNFIEQINNDPYRKEMDYYIAWINNEAVGVTGIYSYNEYPTVAWLGWFGILDKYRRRGYGGEILEKTINMAREKGYREFRLYTNECLKDAQKLYESHNLVKEIYNNKDDIDEYAIGEIYIYSMSLTNDKIQPWNNKILGLKEQGNKEHNS